MHIYVDAAAAMVITFCEGIQCPTLQIQLPKRRKAAVDASSRFSP